MLIRRELPGDIDSIRAVTARAFAPSGDSGGAASGEAVSGGAASAEAVSGEVVEARLVDELRADPGWIPQLSFVAVASSPVGREVVGHVVCTRATIAGRPALGLGPLSVDPPWQRRGVGSALVHAVLGGADARDEPVVVLLGDPAFYHRFGFVLASECGVEPPVAEWSPHFQVRTLSTYRGEMRGSFVYAEPFRRL